MHIYAFRPLAALSSEKPNVIWEKDCGPAPTGLPHELGALGDCVGPFDSDGAELKNASCMAGSESKCGKDHSMVGTVQGMSEGHSVTVEMRLRGKCVANSWRAIRSLGAMREIISSRLVVMR